MSEPKFGCQNDNCAADMSYPANSLRLYAGLPICENCYDGGFCIDVVDAIFPWGELQPFKSEQTLEIEQLRAALKDCLTLIEDMGRFAGSMALKDYALFNEAPINARKLLPSKDAPFSSEEK